ncbi:MAG: insulinase family protein [Lentisphaeria bacterium]|nr:insulinase family protein [Lentisphaeria bacterium]
MPHILPPVLEVGQTCHGFIVEDITVLDTMFMTAYRLAHKRTGAKALHFHCQDDECLFSINFPTPPEDDTGLPHIMEHSVLSGSERFPVRDPFFEMYKMSMATFINAMTGADMTYYPVCSNVKKDLFNLATVYFDAVFHPLLTPETFKREGHHAVPADSENPTGALSINGIVYNEMKAAFSKPEARLGRIAFRQLFPGTCYGNESGGDPVAIPDLTYEGFLAFHDQWYHPSNAHFVFYGEVPPADYLAFLEPRLARFDKRSVTVNFGEIQRWTAPVQLVDSYDIGDEDPAERTFHQINWQVPLDMNPREMVLMEILGIVLVGDDAAPLKKAIIDAGLGSDLLPSGMMQVGRDGMFCVGIRGSEKDRGDAFRELVLAELDKIVKDGVDPELVETAFQRFSYSIREIQHSQPLHVADNALSAWIQGADPLLFLSLQNVLDECREACRKDPAVLLNILEEKLLANPHRLDVCMAPDAEWKAKTDAEFAERMADWRAQLSDDDMCKLARQAEELQQEAGTANSPEALATLPQLKREDLPAEPRFIPTVEKTLSTGNLFMRNDVFSNGVNYLEVYIDLDGLPADLWISVPRYVETLKRLGAAGDDFATMARRTSAATGGFNVHTSYAGHTVRDGVTRKGIVITLKALDEQMPRALDILRDRLFEPDPTDKPRFKDVLNQGLSRMRTGLVNGGPATPLTQIRAGRTEVGFLQEQTTGLSQYREIKRLVDAFDSGFDTVVDQVTRIAQFVRSRRRFTVSFTGSDHAAALCEDTMTRWFDEMPDTPLALVSTGFVPVPGIQRLGFIGPMQVAHCAQILPARHSSDPESSLLSLAMAMLRVDYMVSECRFKGNAYGANCSYDGRSINLSTYADPHVKRTLDVFQGLVDYVRLVPWTDVEVTRGMISTAKSVIRPIRPEDATASALTAWITGETHAVRRERYRVLREATPGHLKAVLLDVLESGFQNAPVAVLSNRDKLEKANAELGENALVLTDLVD